MLVIVEVGFIVGDNMVDLQNLKREVLNINYMIL